MSYYRQLFLSLLIFACIALLLYNMQSYFVKNKHHEKDDNGNNDEGPPIIVGDTSKFYLKYFGSTTHESDGMLVDEENTIYYLISQNVEFDNQISTEDFLFSDGRVQYVGPTKLFHVSFNLEPHGSVEDVRIVFAVHIDGVPVNPRMLYYAPNLLNGSEGTVSMASIVKLENGNFIDLRVGILEYPRNGSTFHSVNIDHGQFFVHEIR